MKKLIVLTLVAYCVSVTANATTHLVPSQYATIQSALNECIPSDTVLVDNGIYTGTLTWPQVNHVVLMSVNGKEATFLDGGFSGSVLLMSGTINKLSATIIGFTIENGYTHASSSNGFVAGGSGMFVTNMIVNLNNCNFATNKVTGDPANFTYCNGSAINAENSKILINQCDFSGNMIDSTYTVYGGVIYVASTQLSISKSNFDSNTILSTSNIQGGIVGVSFGQVVIKDVALTQNQINVSGDGSIVGGGYYIVGNGSAQFTDALIGNNSFTSGNTIQGGGIWSSYMTSLIHCTIAGNHYQSGTGVGGNSISLNGFMSSTPKLKIINSILWNAEGSDFELAFVGIPAVSYTDVRNGFAGPGNIASDPLFVSSKDFHLQNTSPCIARSAVAANPTNDLDGNNRPMPVGTMADLGCYEVNQSVRMDSGSDAFDVTSVQVYPNPVHQSATISFLLNDESDVTVTVLDFSGRIVKNVLNQTFAAGNHQVMLNSDDLRTGDYFVQMQIGDKTFNQKITVD